jgi:hypothetical protein
VEENSFIVVQSCKVQTRTISSSPQTTFHQNGERKLFLSKYIFFHHGEL